MSRFTLDYLAMHRERARKLICKIEGLNVVRGASEEVIEAFKLFAGDSPPGHISLEQLEIALTQYGTNKLNVEKAIRLIDNLEVDDNGFFNFDQYVNLMFDD